MKHVIKDTMIVRRFVLIAAIGFIGLTAGSIVGAERSVRDRNRNILDAVVDEENVDSLRWLLENGAEPDVSNARYGMTPLMFAAMEHKIEACSLLLRYGAKVNAISDAGMTPLICAAEHYAPADDEDDLEEGASTEIRVEVCKLLLKTFLLQPILRERSLSACRERLVTILMTLKRLALPRGLAPLVLCYNDCSLGEDLACVLAMADDTRGLAVGLMPKCILEPGNLETIKKAMKEARAKTNIEELRVFLDPDTLENRVWDILFS